MAIGTCTLTNHGSFDISGTALKTAVDAIVLSGAAAQPAVLHIIPVGGGRVQVLEVDTATA